MAYFIYMNMNRPKHIKANKKDKKKRRKRNTN